MRVIVAHLSIAIRSTISSVSNDKDILTKYREYEEKGNSEAILNVPIETIQKPVLYTPQTKKISQLLQEFKKKTGASCDCRR